MTWRSEVDEYLPVFKAKNKNKMRKDNQLYEIQIREVDKEKKRIKIHYKGFSEDRDEWRDYGSLFDLEGFHTVSSPSAPQFHYSNFRIDISVLFPPSIQQLCQWCSSCVYSHVYESFEVPKSFWRRLEYGC